MKTTKGVPENIHFSEHVPVFFVIVNKIDIICNIKRDKILSLNYPKRKIYEL